MKKDNNNVNKTSSFGIELLKLFLVMFILLIILLLVKEFIL